MRFWPTGLNVALRILIATPLAPVFALLCLSIIGIPIAFALMLPVGAWITAPLRRHPLFNTACTNNDPYNPDNPLVEDLT